MLGAAFLALVWAYVSRYLNGWWQFAAVMGALFCVSFATGWFVFKLVVPWAT
jgi:hypothetical protein